MKFRYHFVFLTLLLLPYHSLHAQLLEKKVLSLEAAEKVASAAALEANKRNARVVIVVVDDGGYPLVLKRLDDTQVASVEVGIGKARTAAIFRRPSRDFEEQIKTGRVASLVLPGATPLQGGLPLIAGGKVVGAIGVSGNTPQEDEDIAKAGATAFSAMMTSAQSSAVTYLPAKKVSQAFTQGMPLVRGMNYKIDASHRDEPGSVEVHTRDTDLIYMLEGTATLVTGGTITDEKAIEPEEIRGRKSEGGETRIVSKGDVIVIPNGTPHWFKEVNGAINYYVVKVRSAN
ncbi:MAG TPA: heme-binding protein [Candidatus Binatia bacterium]|jgi:glc operon protein GlcG|nr:heme-binding protein [Candidatus Binatia bacterium]